MSDTNEKPQEHTTAVALPDGSGRASKGGAWVGIVGFLVLFAAIMAIFVYADAKYDEPGPPSEAFKMGWSTGRIMTPGDTCEIAADSYIANGVAMSSTERYEFVGGCDAGFADVYGHEPGQS